MVGPTGSGVLLPGIFKMVGNVGFDHQQIIIATTGIRHQGISSRVYEKKRNYG